MTYKPDIKTFQDCLGIASQISCNNHLLLGNGFSVDLFPGIFNYKALAERIKSMRIKQLFDQIGTNDFEYVMRKLTGAVEIVRLYPDSVSFCELLKADLEEIKSALISVISESHPPKPNSITNQQYNYCHAFLSHFKGKKYSFNYDLLLYWVYMHFIDHEDKEKRLECDDGFRHPEKEQSIVTWEIGMEHEQNVYYLHGAMHIFSDGNIIEKYTWINDGRTITEQVRGSINSQKYPVFISEGTMKHKMARIKDSSYLGRAFSSLKSISGNLFIFGHSLRDEDDHVFNYINVKSRVKNIFISIFGDPNTVDNQRIFKKVLQWQQKFKKKNYYYYYSNSANVWGSKN